MPRAARIDSVAQFTVNPIFLPEFCSEEAQTSLLERFGWPA